MEIHCDQPARFTTGGRRKRCTQQICKAERMPWLVSKGRVLASAELATGRLGKAKGLLGRNAFEGAFVIDHCKSVHTIGMRFAIDVAYVDAEGTVLRVRTMRPHRVDLPERKATMVIEAEAGAFERWGLAVGQTVEIRE
jgi:uncharacterized protein